VVVVVGRWSRVVGSGGVENRVCCALLPDGRMLLLSAVWKVV
jgi:hypothetical protein